jgi:hypothetical protein
MTTPDHRPPELARKHHRFLRPRLPWYIQLIWMAFWLFALAFVVYFLFPALQKQLLSVP